MTMDSKRSRKHRRDGDGTTGKWKRRNDPATSLADDEEKARLLPDKKAQEAMTDEELKRDRETCEKATPGPWTQHERAKSAVVGPTGYSVATCACDSERQSEWHGNAAFIAAARTRWPERLDEIDHLRADVRRLETLIEAHDTVRREDVEKAQAETEGARVVWRTALKQTERERDEARAEVRTLVKALRHMQVAADFYVRWGCGVGDEDSGGSSFDRLARAAGEAKTVLAGYEVDDG